MIEKRLGAGILPLSRENHNLIVRGNAHSETALRYGPETLSARRGTNLSLETYALALELNLSRIERGERFGLLNADRAPPNDSERDEQETRD
jgi:hypothetical protein